MRFGAGKGTFAEASASLGRAVSGCCEKLAQSKKIPVTIAVTGIHLWRSRRDLNPRAAYGDNTISNRARYDHFDTTPYRSLFRTALTIIPEKSCLSRKNAKFVVEIYPAHIRGAEQ